MKRKKILINTPYLKDHGGVVNHFLGLKPYWSADVRYNVIGKRSKWNGSGVLFLPYDIIKFVLKLLWWRPDAILLNPSLNKSAVTRDMIFLGIGVLLKVKTYVMFHGWRPDYAEIVDKAKLSNQLNRSAGIMVLCSSFKESLISWGVTVPIFLVTTKVDDRLLSGFDITKSQREKVDKILFLARIEKEKGIFEALKTFEIIHKKYPNKRIIVAGDGSALAEAKMMVKKENMANVSFLGYLQGDDLKRQFVDCDVYLFTSYHEGMPTSVLEAMAFGLPVITSSVGGLVDFFENGKMGRMIEKLDPELFANELDNLICHPEKVKATSRYNHDYARTHFFASEVAKIMEKIILG